MRGWGLFAVIALGACGGSGAALFCDSDAGVLPDASSPFCIPGAQLACACPGGGQGVQVCDQAGATLGACVGCMMGSGGAPSSSSSSAASSGGGTGGAPPDAGPDAGEAGLDDAGDGGVDAPGDALACDGGPPYPPSCSNGKLDMGETDTDCGGPCQPCFSGKHCGGPCDCTSGICEAATCF